MQNGKMSPERWERIKSVVQAALECEPDARADYLAKACASEPALRAEVESLIAYQAGGSGFIEAPAFARASGAPLPDDSPSGTPGDIALEAELSGRAGQQIGPYRVVCGLGQGGMGAVYLAERADDEYRKQVAIKLIKRGMDSEFVLRRFRNERQILAALDHPNIARLLDGGTTEDGLPYLVMEYIEGTPLDEYCAQRQLTTAERLQLFRQVCAAVHYAHQHLVIHRDLKPSNILVTADGTPKLLDFGIAKLLTPELAAETLDQTQGGLRLMTPAYASPEQVKGEPITTASDVYALGVVLYELLTGHSPYRLRENTQQEILRAICEQEPERPSTASTSAEHASESASGSSDPQSKRLQRVLKGDIDNIVLMALRKEPTRRYASVEQFSEDIRRHLEGLPVSAHKDTLSYRSAKFIRRHRAGVAAAAIVLLTLVGGIIATAWQARVARAERARAERRFNDVRRLANSFMFELHDEIDKGAIKAKELLVKRALEYLDSLSQEAANDIELQRELATAYFKIGDVQGRVLAANIGDTKGALASYQKAVALFDKLAALEPAHREIQHERVYSYERLGEISLTLGKPADAVAHFRKAIPLVEDLLATEPTNATFRTDLGTLHRMLGMALGLPGVASLGDTKGALEYLRKAVELYEVVPAEASHNTPKARFSLLFRLDRRFNLAATYSDISTVLDALGKLSESADASRKSLAIYELLVADNPKDVIVRRNRAAQFWNMANTLLSLGQVAEAVEMTSRSRTVFTELAAEDKNDLNAQKDLAQSYRNTGKVLAAAKDYSRAAEYNRQAVAIFEELVAKDQANGYLRRQLALTYVRLSTNLSNQEELARAIENARRAISLGEALTTADPKNATALGTLADSYTQLGKCHTLLATKASTPADKRKGHWVEARAWYQKGLEIWQNLRQKGLLNGADAGKPDELAREIAKCEAALSKSR